MSYILAISTNQVYREIHLPIVNNTDYRFVLRGKDYSLPRDVHLHMDVIDGKWSFLQSDEYRILQNCYDDYPKVFKGYLSHGQILNLQTEGDNNLAILVWEAKKKFPICKKYRVLRNEITIGSDSKNDICYSAHGVLSRCHARIEYSGTQAILLDLPTKNGTYNNGTYVRGQRVLERYSLSFGDTICLHGLTIIFLGRVLSICSLDCGEYIHSAHLAPMTLEDFSSKKQGTFEKKESDIMVHISPRNLPIIYEKEERIEPVPAKTDDDKKPAWMTVLPSITMVLPMILGYSLMGSHMGTGLIISGGSAAVGVTWSIINLRYARKQSQARERYRLKKYEEYLVQSSERIRQKFDHNRQCLLELYPDAVTCCRYNDTSTDVWARKRKQTDFLFIRLGIGEKKFQVPISAPTVKFSLDSDELAERAEKIAQSFAQMRDVPLGVSLREHRVIGIVTNDENEKASSLIRVITSQIVATHSYTDVKIVFIFDESRENSDQWSYIRWLPHVWNEDRSMRYVASNVTDSNVVLYSLTQILRARLEQKIQSTSSAREPYYPHYVVITEDGSVLESQLVSKYLFDSDMDLGVTTIISSCDYDSLPSSCDYVVENTREFQGVYALREGGDEKQTIEFDDVGLREVCSLAHRMSSWKVNQIESSSDLPNSLTFFEMLGVHRLEEINVLELWKKNRTYESMRALIGQKAGGNNCYLDINEKYHGPHGLVAGTTGSGKSETLQTYILSLAINFSPLDVGLFIIDYKGGGMANLFSNLPHLLGQASNLSGNKIHRALVSIRSEKDRRQRIFNDHSVNNIDDYTRLVKSGEASQPLPHLLIIIDEFAELKRERREFMQELISIAQVGRSLGIHLILSTQKPSTSVDENIWSNTKFKLCLRVADKKDSNDMLHKPDAAYITQAGRGYFQVGNDEIYELFQSGWSGAPYNENGESVSSPATMIDLQGQKAVTGSKARTDQNRRAQERWICKVARAVQVVCTKREIHLPKRKKEREQFFDAVEEIIQLLNQNEYCIADSVANKKRLEDIMGLWPVQETDELKIARYLIQRFSENRLRLPEEKQRTQLDAVISYLANIAHQYGFENKQKLWLPFLPSTISLAAISEYQSVSFGDGRWQQHEKQFGLPCYIGMVDDPENQLQYPLNIDLARHGHLLVAGSVTSGKSTFAQTLCYSLISTYCPDMLHLYVLDFSSQMLTAFESAPHFGGYILEGENDRLSKFFGMMSKILQQRKMQIKGGSYSQYVQANGYKIAPIVIVIDGYANFREKTEERYTDALMELVRSAEGYGIYLVITCGGLGSGELHPRIAENMRQSICLELGDKYKYGEILHTMRFDILPEQGIKGRGLAMVGESVLEYQTAVCCSSENDYARSEWIRQQCENMSQLWNGARAKSIPEIPDKPVWTVFSASEEYMNELAANMLPIAYCQEDASLYSLKLSTLFCYLVIGQERSGKSNLLRNIVCAGQSLGASVHVIDSENGNERQLADMVNGSYASSYDELRLTVNDMVQMLNQRASVRRDYRTQGLDDEEIYPIICRQFPPVFYVITNLQDFIARVYHHSGNLAPLNASVEQVFGKCQFLNVYFFAAENAGDYRSGSASGKRAYQLFLKDKNGTVLGGELQKQSFLEYANIGFAQSQQRLKMGMAYAADQNNPQNVQMIVIPRNKGFRVT